MDNFYNVVTILSFFLHLSFTDSWKDLMSKILWHCPFNLTVTKSKLDTAVAMAEGADVAAETEWPTATFLHGLHDL